MLPIYSNAFVEGNYLQFDSNITILGIRLTTSQQVKASYRIRKWPSFKPMTSHSLTHVYNTIWWWVKIRETLSHCLFLKPWCVWCIEAIDSSSQQYAQSLRFVVFYYDLLFIDLFWTPAGSRWAARGARIYETRLFYDFPGLGVFTYNHDKA